MCRNSFFNYKCSIVEWPKRQRQTTNSMTKWNRRRIWLYLVLIQWNLFCSSVFLSIFGMWWQPNKWDTRVKKTRFFVESKEWNQTLNKNHIKQYTAEASFWGVSARFGALSSSSVSFQFGPKMKSFFFHVEIKRRRHLWKMAEKKYVTLLQCDPNRSWIARAIQCWTVWHLKMIFTVPFRVAVWCWFIVTWVSASHSHSPSRSMARLINPENNCCSDEMLFTIPKWWW